MIPPGVAIQREYFNNVSTETAAARIGADVAELAEVFAGKAGITPVLAAKIGKTVGRDPQSFINLQRYYADRSW